MWSIILNTNSVFGFICWFREVDGLYASIGHVGLYLELFKHTANLRSVFSTGFNNKHLSRKPHLHGEVFVSGGCNFFVHSENAWSGGCC